jgi:hypothetical protein
MRNFYKLFLLLIMAVGLVMIGCGGNPVPKIDATDGDSADIVVTWSNCGGKKTSSYEVFRATDPTGSFTSIGTTATESYTDTAPGSANAFFYQVQADDADTKCGVALDNFYPIVDGGYATGWTPSTAFRHCFSSAWQKANSCIHDLTNLCTPDPLPGMDDLYIGTSGSMRVTFNLDVGSETMAAVPFDFQGYSAACTNGVSMDGMQSAVVNVSTYDGFMLGLTEYDDGGSCAGWVLYNIDVDNRQTAGGMHYYGSGSTVGFEVPSGVVNPPCTDCSAGTGSPCCTDEALCP